MDIEFGFKPNVEGEKANNNGYVVRRLEVFGPENPDYGEFGPMGGICGGEVGYINVTYITEENWEKRYTGKYGIVRWISDFKNVPISVPGESPIERKSPFQNLVKNLSKEAERSRSDWLSRSKAEEMSRSELESLFDVYKSAIEDKYEKEKSACKEFHVEKPRVEFVHVAKNYRRRGIGMALYKEMTRILNEHYNLPLHSTNLQREAAEKLWDKMVTLDWNTADEVEYPFEDDDRTRYALSVKKTVMC